MIFRSHFHNDIHLMNVEGQYFFLPHSRHDFEFHEQIIFKPQLRLLNFKRLPVLNQICETNDSSTELNIFIIQSYLLCNEH